MLSVIEPILEELSPLSKKALSEFTRSTLSKSVLQNVLAHVVAAEAESTTSETERLDAAMDDNFGPEEVGDNFIIETGSETIVAAKGLVDLHNDSCDFHTQFNLTFSLSEVSTH